MQKPKKILYEESLIKFSGKSRNVLALIVIGLSSVHFVAFFVLGSNLKNLLIPYFAGLYCIESTWLRVLV